MKKFLLLKIILLLLFSGPLFAQTRVINGKITTSEDGSPLPGVNIVVKGSANGTNSDADGRYSMTVLNTDVLIVSFIGYVTQEVPVGSQTLVDISLSQDTKQLSEVVVVGYGTEEKRELTGNVAHVDGSAIRGVPVTSIEQSLQGRAAGVFIESGSGKLGQAIKVRIRGSASLSASNQPLYVIDGIPITTESQSSTSAETNPLADLNFNDVESVNILKDASAVAIYGSRGANGVVLITTRRGKAGKTSFTVGYFTGVSHETHRRKFMNAQQYITAETQAGVNGDYVDLVTSRLNRYSVSNDYTKATTSTDWQDQVFRAAPINQLDVTASGGNEKTRFFVSGQYSDQNGILIGNHLKKITGRMNLDHQATEKLSFGVNFNLARTENHRLSNDDAFSTPLQIVALAPITPTIDPRTGLTSGQLDLTTGVPNSNFPTYYNPMLSVGNASYVATVYRVFANAFAQYKIMPSLTFRSELGTDLLLQEENQYLNSVTQRDTGTPNGQGFSATTIVSNYTTNNYFKLDKGFGQSFVNVTAGMSFQKSSNFGSSATAQQFANDKYKTISSAASVIGATAGATEFAFLSYFARANYKFKDRYLLDLSGRVDGSSRFGANHRYGFFPAASAGWIVSEENFMKSISVISSLKLKASYGLAGNAGVNNFAARGLYGPANYVGQGGQAQAQLENPNLKWETTAQTDVGMEWGILGGRLTGELDYYYKKTTNLLLNQNVNGTSGFSTYTSNIGSLQNKGFEIVLTSQNLVGDVTWSTSFNIATNQNKVLYLQHQILGTANDVNRAIEGSPIGVFYGRQFAGADPTNGDALYYLNTADNPHGTTNNYNAAQQVVLGNPNPKWIGGITNTLGYKGIDLNFMFQGVQGNKIYNGGGQYMSASASNGFDNQTVDQLNAWQKPGDITAVPQLRTFGNNTGLSPSSRWLTDGSYIRLKTITLGYTLPKALVNRMKLEKFRVYVTAQNLFTFTHYKGWDPEVNADFLASNIVQGNDFYTAPQPKTITGGVSIGF